MNVPQLTYQIQVTLLYVADECTSPQVCNAVDTAAGTCVTPIAAGADCAAAADNNPARELCQHKPENRCLQNFSVDFPWFSFLLVCC